MANSVNRYNYRFLARLVIQAETPLSVGSGEYDILSGKVVAKDANGLPYIPGTAIAGIVRHAIGEENAKPFFGFNESTTERKQRVERNKVSGMSGSDNILNIDEGSKIIFSSAQIVDEEGLVVEGLDLNRVKKSKFLSCFNSLPKRQHVRINGSGTSEKNGKFEEEVIYKGTRFCFEIEMLSSDFKNTNLFEKVLLEIATKTNRLGGGTRRGLGEIRVVECKKMNLDLFVPNDLKVYIEKTSSLNDHFWNECPVFNLQQQSDGLNWTTYTLRLNAEDFFLFGSGLGNEYADITPVCETYFDWPKDNKPSIIEKAILIPGSSVKGAISHRVAFHYNKIKGVFSDELSTEEMKIHVGSNNPAVQAVFGYVVDDKHIERGNIQISDVIQTVVDEQNKLMNHVSIDRFTGGAIAGALYSEEVTYAKNCKYTLTLNVFANALKDDAVREAFDATLDDIVNGLLPLGGGTNRGYGFFNGSILINGENKL